MMASEEPAKSQNDTPPGGSAQPGSPSPTLHGPAALWAKIKRHKVVEWTLAYVAFSYATLHGVEMLQGAFSWPEIVPRLSVLILILGLPVTVTLAWYHGHRAQHRISGPELLIVSLLLAVGGTVVWGLSRPRQNHAASISQLPRASGVSDKSIAVLPFVDMSEKHDQEYFADGTAEEILDLLAKIPQLKVIGRTSSFQFKGHPEDLRSIGAKLGAAYLVEGSIRKSADKIRVTAQLIDSASGTHLWSDTYDRPFGDVLALQDQIAAAITAALAIGTGADVNATLHPVLRNPSAYEAYLRGRYAMARFDKEGFESAVAYFQQALELDPSSAAATAWLAGAWDGLGEWGFAPAAGAFEEARNAATRALRLSSSVSMAHTVLGGIHTAYDWDWEAARHEFEDARRSGPATGWSLFFEGRLYGVQGEWSEALRIGQRALSLDPLNPGLHVLVGRASLGVGDLTTAESELRRTIEISPTYVSARFYLGWVLLQSGKIEQARQMMLQEIPEGGRDRGLAMVFQVMGKRADAAAASQRFVRFWAGSAPADVAYLYAYLGRTEEAFTWLERAYRQRDTELMLVKSDPGVERLRDDPRYKAFLRKMNLPD
jgi:TolB-like protein